jgi:hypothetical protein
MKPNLGNEIMKQQWCCAALAGWAAECAQIAKESTRNTTKVRFEKVQVWL